MKRIVWIAGLSFALLVFGGITVAIAFAWLSHRHLNNKGFVMLLGNGWATWFIFRELCQRVSGATLYRPSSDLTVVRGPSIPEDSTN